MAEEAKKDREGLCRVVASLKGKIRTALALRDYTLAADLSWRLLESSDLAEARAWIMSLDVPRETAAPWNQISSQELSDNSGRTDGWML